MAVSEQRERNAAKAKKKVDQRREDASGAAGWVAERAGRSRGGACSPSSART